MFETILETIKILLLINIGAYIFLGALFFIFISTLLKDPITGKPVIRISSWHGRVAYPFKKFSRSPDYGNLAQNFFSYWTKIFFMLLLGWPILILWETVKIILYAPFMLLFGYYPIPSFDVMSEGENPLFINPKQIYLPTIADRISIVPIIPVGIVLYTWLLYKYLFWTLVTTGSIVLLVVLLGILVRLVAEAWEDRRLDSMANRIRNLSKKIGKYNPKINISR